MDEHDTQADSPHDLVNMGSVGDLFTGHLNRANYLLSRTTEKAWAHLDLRTGTIAAMSIIIDNPGLSQKEVAARTTFDKSAINAIINRLEELGWATRYKVESDRRRHALHPTPKGKKALASLITRVRQIETRMLAGLSESEQKQLRNLLDRAHDSFLAATGTRNFS